MADEKSRSPDSPTRKNDRPRARARHVESVLGAVVEERSALAAFIYRFEKCARRGLPSGVVDAWTEDAIADARARFEGVTEERLRFLLGL